LLDHAFEQRVQSRWHSYRFLSNGSVFAAGHFANGRFAERRIAERRPHGGARLNEPVVYRIVDII
jgi:hypothetical protein